jgi:hypothetical protein
MMFDALLLLLTLLLGAALARVSLCAVAAVQQCVGQREPAALMRLLLATSAAGMVLLASSGWSPMRMALPGALPITLPLISGALLLGAGALLNGACYLGSVLYLGNGNLNFLFTLLGLGAGARMAAVWLSAQLPAMHASMAISDALRWAGFGLFAVLAASLLAMRAARRSAAWPLLAGAVAGLVYARHPGWTYSQVVDSVASADWRGASWLANLAALSLFAGAIISSIWSGRWHRQNPRPARALRCLAGGLLMGVGAKLIPGGSDMLLLWAIPGLTLYGAVAYLIMLATLALSFAAAEIRRQQNRKALKLAP